MWAVNVQCSAQSFRALFQPADPGSEGLVGTTATVVGHRHDEFIVCGSCRNSDGRRGGVLYGIRDRLTDREVRASFRCGGASVGEGGVEFDGQTGAAGEFLQIGRASCRERVF